MRKRMCSKCRGRLKLWKKLEKNLSKLPKQPITSVRYVESLGSHAEQDING